VVEDFLELLRRLSCLQELDRLGGIIPAGMAIAGM